MIKNERQYKISKSKLAEFEDSISEINKTDLSTIEKSMVDQVFSSALESQFEELKNDIEEYEELKSGNVTFLKSYSLVELPNILIKSRIAQGLTQRELADRLSLKEQQIQRYESDDYRTASLERLLEITKALRIQIDNKVTIPSKKTNLSRIIKGLENSGFNKEFIYKRLMPKKIISTDKKSETEKGVNVLSYLSNIFEDSIDSFINDNKFDFNDSTYSITYYKTAKNVNTKTLLPYTIYAHKLALLSTFASGHIEIKEIPFDPQNFREYVLDTYNEFNFESVLNYAWDLGIIVLPLNDSGAFHGACWRFNGRNVIVIKQKQFSHARWLFDLLHEIRHAAESQDQLEHEVIEAQPIKFEYLESESEITASLFAEDATLDSKSEYLEEKCVKLAGGNLEKLRTSVIRVAKEEGIEVGSLANHLAFRLSEEGHDWWGTAQNLQVTDPNPWELAKEIFFQRVNLFQLNNLDREILINSLSN